MYILVHTMMEPYLAVKTYYSKCTFVIEDKSKLYIGIMPRRGNFIIAVLTYVDVRYVHLCSKVSAHL